MNSSISSTPHYVLGIDIGGTTTIVGLVDRDGHILRREEIATKQYCDADSYVGDLSDCINRIICERGGLNLFRGIGGGAPNANYFTGRIHESANLSWLNDVPLARRISERTNLPVSLNNDANAATIGEMIYGAAKGMRDFILITLGTGVGSGIVSNGELVYGRDGLAGELGHVIVRPQGRPCGCGRRGCLETYTSATAVVRTARELLEDPKFRGGSLLREVEPSELTSKRVYEAATGGDPLALRVFEYTGEMLGEAFANFVAYSNPEAIILFGGLTKAGELLLAPTRKAMQENLLHVYGESTKLLLSLLPENDAAVLGAAAMGWKA